MNGLAASVHRRSRSHAPGQVAGRDPALARGAGLSPGARGLRHRQGRGRWAADHAGHDLARRRQELSQCRRARRRQSALHRQFDHGRRHRRRARPDRGDGDSDRHGQDRRLHLRRHRAHRRFALCRRRRRRRFLGRMGHVRQCRQQRHGLSPSHGALRLALGAPRLDRGDLPQARRDESQRCHARSRSPSTTTRTRA